jgi:hypothetical protein
MPASRTCPRCSANRVVPISYGEPTPAPLRAAGLGLLMSTSFGIVSLDRILGGGA